MGNLARLRLTSKLLASLAMFLVTVMLSFAGRAMEAERLLLPMSFYEQRILSPFGQVKLKFGGNAHVGDDVRGAKGTPVYAVAAGQVVLSRHWPPEEFTCKSWGYIVVIRHELLSGRVFHSVSSHLAGTHMPPEGSEVSAGAVIGKIGAYQVGGRKCWPDHLHFAIRSGDAQAEVGEYPAWLRGYLPPKVFPGRYCDPVPFLRFGDCRK